MRRPMGKKYPTDPQTIGKQLLKRRMDLRLLQKDVAQMIGVTEELEAPEALITSGRNSKSTKAGNF